MIIREAVEYDARGLLALFYKLDVETDQMLFEPEERTTSLAEQRSIIEQFSDDERRLFLVAEDEGVVGFCVLVSGTLARTRHVASLVIGVCQSRCSQGVGSQLVENALEWAHRVRIRRIELTVRSDNERAIALYRKFGFVKEGERADSLYVDGGFRNESYMARLA